MLANKIFLYSVNKKSDILTMLPMKLMTQTSDGDKREVTMISTYLSHYVDHFAECVEYSRIRLSCNVHVPST